MRKVMVIKSSIRGEQSVSNELVNRTLKEMGEGWCEVDEYNLANMNLDHINQDFLSKKCDNCLSVNFIEELEKSDIIVIGCPLYNFGPSSYLKSFVDMITISGKTFEYCDGVPKGLLKPGKKLIICYASNGVPMNSAMDFATPWLKTVFKFMGVTDFEEKS